MKEFNLADTNRDGLLSLAENFRYLQMFYAEDDLRIAELGLGHVQTPMLYTLGNPDHIILTNVKGDSNTNTLQ